MVFTAHSSLYRRFLCHGKFITAVEEELFYDKIPRLVNPIMSKQLSSSVIVGFLLYRSLV